MVTVELRPEGFRGLRQSQCCKETCLTNKNEHFTFFLCWLVCYLLCLLTAASGNWTWQRCTRHWSEAELYLQNCSLQLLCCWQLTRKQIFLTVCQNVWRTPHPTPLSGNRVHLRKQQYLPLKFGLGRAEDASWSCWEQLRRWEKLNELQLDWCSTWC